jgi:putative colanic acid biosynthesis glycosyltransferase
MTVFAERHPLGRLSAQRTMSEVADVENALCRGRDQNRFGAPLVSVVTVVFNAVREIGPTAASVWAQDYPNVEYIVVDGGSSDGTIEFLRANDYLIDVLLSEPDTGIYDAMNKGAALASGDWIVFLNAGDRFTTSSVLSRVFAKRQWLGDEYIYGDHCVVYPDGRRRYAVALPIEKVWRGMVMCHQSLFSPRRGLVAVAFDEAWGTAADYAFVGRVFSAGGRFIRLQGLCVVDYSSGGVSDTHRLKSLALSYRVSQRYALAPRYKSLVWFGLRIGSELVKIGVKRLLP